ncbi:MAG: M36 family metallopeptidase [Acidobacteriota bacterium]
MVRLDARAVASIFSCALLALAAIPADAAGQGPIRFLTGPQEGDAYDLALAYIEAHRGELGLTAADIEDMVVSDKYVSRHNGTTHIYLKQRFEGIEVYNAILNVNVARDGSIINLGNNFVSNLADKVEDRSAVKSDVEAIQSAARHYGLTATGELTLLEYKGGDELAASYAPAGLSRDAIPAKLVYTPLEDGRVRLSWETTLQLVQGTDWWNVRVDAITGEVISQYNFTSSDSYLAIPFPDNDSPDDSGGQIVVNDPADPTASPFGWHDTNGLAGAEFTDTRGNNVNAQDDLDGNNVGGVRPDGGASLDFNFVFNPAQQPAEGTNLMASIVNLFYANNVMHDLTYQYGFDEPSGNFQFNNYGNGGLGNDPVRADAQDGAEATIPSFNNATFGTPSDGASGVMSMFQWKPPVDALVTVNSPGSIADDYVASSSNFGPQLDATGPITDDVELVNDGAGGAGSPSDGCEPLIGFTAGNIALVDRGNCDFSLKVFNAQTASATGVIIGNDRPGILHPGAGANAGQVTIPSVLILQTDAATIKTGLGAGVNATMDLDPSAPPRRDSDFDNGIIAHEYGHGISNRLTGGPNTATCLGGSEQAGEGWSDFWTLLLTAEASDEPDVGRGVGNYVIFEPVTGDGIRNFPYTTDMVANPQTYNDIGSTNVPHGVGEIWMAMVWEMYWELIAKHGFDGDHYNGTGGNNITIQLVMDGMKLQPCLPDFVEARDAILLADMNNYGGENQCEIWRAFAKRGLGVSAVAGSPDGVPNAGDEAEAFDIPGECPAEGGSIFTDGFESGDTSAW